MLPVTARRILKGGSKRGRASAAGSGIGPLNWQGWINALASGEKNNNILFGRHPTSASFP